MLMMLTIIKIRSYKNSCNRGWVVLPIISRLLAPVQTLFKDIKNK